MNATQGLPQPTPAVSNDGVGVGTIFDGVVAACAIGALILSLYQQWAHHRSSKPRVRVTLSQGFIGRGGYTSEA